MRDEPVLMTLGQLKRRLEELSAEHGDETVVIVPNIARDSLFFQPKQVEITTVVNNPTRRINTFDWERVVPEEQPRGASIRAILIH